MANAIERKTSLDKDHTITVDGLDLEIHLVVGQSFRSLSPIYDGFRSLPIYGFGANVLIAQELREGSRSEYGDLIVGKPEVRIYLNAPREVFVEASERQKLEALSNKIKAHLSTYNP